MENEQNRTTEENIKKIVDILELQQKAIRNNLQLQVANLIVVMLLFIFMIVIVVLK